MRPSQIVEAVLFSSDAPLKAEEIARADESLDEDRVDEAIRELRKHYDEAERGFQVEEVAEGYQILTRPEFAPYLERFDTVPRPSRLSGPALESLAIIAYRQPIGRIEVEYIRGVSSSGVIRSLQDRGLVEVVGRGEGLGRPLLYGTTARFLEHFGFSALEDLPRPEELPVVLRDRIDLGLEDDDEEEGENPQLSLNSAPGEAPATPGAEEAEASEIGPRAEDPQDEAAAPRAETEPRGEEEGAEPHREAEPQAEAEPHREAAPHGEDETLEVRDALFASEAEPQGPEA